MVSHSLKEELINEYLESHPNISRSQIVTRFKNGRIAFEIVDNLADVVFKK